MAVLFLAGGIAVGYAVGGHDATAAAAEGTPSFTTTAPGDTTPKPTKPAGLVTLLNVKGSGIKNTARFTSGDDWTIHYTFSCAAFGSKGNFVVEVYDGDAPGDIPVNDLATKGSDSSQEHGDPGSHYLSVNSECSWTLKVTEP